jgi:membrane protein
MADQAAAGRHAEKPSEFRGRAWRDVGKRTAGEVKKDRLSLVAAGVAFYAFLALFPAIAAIVSIYGMVANPADIQQAVQGMRGMLPTEVVDIVSRQMSSIASASGAALGLSAIISLLLAIWSTTKGTKALMEALNIAYNEREERGFVRLNAVALLLTLGAIVGLILAAVLVVAFPALVGALGLPDTLATVISWARWPVLALALMVGLALFYRYGPSRAAPRFRWVSWGAVAATVLWLIASGLFSFYVSNFGSYNETYGSIAAIVILLMWFYISAFVILLGAEMNAEMEHQTERDTTTGEPVPMGARQAAMADTAAGEAPHRRPPPAEEHPARAAHEGGKGARRPGVDVLAADTERARAAFRDTLVSLGARLTPRSAADTVIGALREGRASPATTRPGRGTFDYLRKERPLLVGALGMAMGAALAHTGAKGRRPEAPGEHPSH